LFHASFGRRRLIALAAVLAAVASQAQAIPRQDPAHCKGQPEIAPLQPLTLVTARGPVRLMVEYADTETKREYGLMCRRALAPDRGMLFDFKTPQNVAFWMRNTLIPLDIVYIRADGRVLSIARNARPLDETPLASGGEIRGVLELPGGRAGQLGLLPGDKVIHRIFP
jgi:uncharacterized membrane protein (UPF0127 family)